MTRITNGVTEEMHPFYLQKLLKFILKDTSTPCSKYVLNLVPIKAKLQDISLGTRSKLPIMFN